MAIEDGALVFRHPFGDESPARFTASVSDDADGWRTLALTGELDASSDAAFRAAVRAITAAEEFSRLIVDLSALVFLDSTGLRGVLGIYELCAGNSVELCLIPGPPAVQQAFRMSALLQGLPFTSGGPQDAPAG